MTIDPGVLDRQIAIMSRSPVQDATGQPVYSESILATVWAQRMEQRLSEVFAAGADRPAGRVVWRIRWRDDVTSAMIVEYGGERWEIEAVQEYGRREGLDLICSRVGASA